MADETVRLAASQLDQAAEMLARAFRDDPMTEYIFANAGDPGRPLRRLFRATLGYGLVYGEVYTTPDVRGVACWLSPGRTEMTLWRHLRTGLLLPRAVLGLDLPALRRSLTFQAVTDGVRHRSTGGRPYWYLVVLGVEPAYQGRGIGSRLIGPVLAKADASGLACYLETMTERNVAFYEKRGFRVTRAVDIDHGPRLWGMLREPRR